MSALQLFVSQASYASLMTSFAVAEETFVTNPNAFSQGSDKQLDTDIQGLALPVLAPSDPEAKESDLTQAEPSNTDTSESQTSNLISYAPLAVSAFLIGISVLWNRFMGPQAQDQD